LEARSVLGVGVDWWTRLQKLAAARVQLGTKIVATRYNSVFRSSKRFCQHSLTRWQSLKFQQSEMSSEYRHMLQGDLQTAAERTNDEWSNKPRTVHS
jgi:hypothetical protein